MTASSDNLSPSARARAGFAVLLTLVLLSFLVLLLVAMATFAKVEDGISNNTLKQAQARQNALTALNIALGRLQKFAGPDTRVTATAEAFGGGNGTSHYTGVWDSTGPGTTPLTWLVSGSEGSDPLAVTPASVGDPVELVGAATAGVANDTFVPKRAILAAGVPGQAGSVTVGNYAWWVGDEGVKAQVTMTDRTDGITYAPFDAVELRSRIRQQLALGAGPADSAGQPIFEPRDATNAALAPNVTGSTQFVFLRRPDGVTEVGSNLARQNFHTWSAGNFAVLANTKLGGLRQDLSLKPDLLGAAFAAWMDYARYMENPASPGSPAPSPAYPAAGPQEALRRRYRMTAPQTAAGITHAVAPVPSYFLLTFNIRTDQSASGATRPLEVRARWMVSFWNPYTSALVPEDLQLEVANLPAVQVVNDTAGTTVGTISLDSLYGAPLDIRLPWQADGRDDQQSWLPGRVYTWAAQQDLNKGSAPPSGGFSSQFYTRTLSTAAGQGVQRSVPGVVMANAAQAHLVSGPAQLTLKLYRSQAGGGRELLGTFLSPAFDAFVTTPGAASAATYQFSYVFHLAESSDTPATPDIWLGTAGQDAREVPLPAGGFMPGANGPRPELYANYTSISFPDRLLDRALPASVSSTTGQSYNEDAPLFELPRAPVLSLGELQQLHTAGTRPYAIGNSWGHPGGWNALFDQYFFSGLASGVASPDLSPGSVLPNPLLRVTSRKADGSVLAIGDLTAQAASGYSSKYLQQGGAFNLNSVNPAAWLAVMRAGRFVSGTNFGYLDASGSTGTRADAPAVQQSLNDVVFFRFPFSAQETYKADAGYAASTTVPPAGPNNVSSANTHLFRRGVRVLSAEQSVALAEAIVARLRAWQAVAGPFRTLEDFLAPSPLFGGENLLGQALADAVTANGRHINDPQTVAEFSSQWLTPGDIMGALAPMLFTRSDTFVIRAYGDTVNPATGEVEARAWAEARVQRAPDYADSAQPAETAPAMLNPTNQASGRRFKVVYFKWLESADI